MTRKLYPTLALLLAAAPVTLLSESAARPAKPKPAMSFTPAELDLAPGETLPVALFVPSPTGRALASTLTYKTTDDSRIGVQPDSRWNGKVPAGGVKTFPRITSAAGDAGDVRVTARLAKGGAAAMLVRIAAPRVEPVPGQLQLTVRITNPFRARSMSGRVVAANPDRFLQDITTRNFKIEAGQTGDVVFPLPGAAPAESETYDFTLTVQTHQGYLDKRTYALRFPPHPQP